MDRDLHELTTAELRQRLRERLPARAPVPNEVRIGPFPEAVTARIRHAFPPRPRAAAVLIPLVDRGDEINVLLTYRSSGLEHHAGQISFPGGRLEPQDPDAESGALRETEEEIGLAREFIEVIGRLPDHIIISGFQVTPVVAMVRPGFGRPRPGGPASSRRRCGTCSTRAPIRRGPCASARRTWRSSTCPGRNTGSGARRPGCC